MSFVQDEFAQQFFDAVLEQTREAESKFTTGPNHLSRDLPDKTFWLSVLTEEVGKIARACNKLSILPPGWRDSRQTWNDEGKRRLVSIASMALRMAGSWDELPDERRGKWRMGLLAQEDPGAVVAEEGS